MAGAKRIATSKAAVICSAWLGYASRFDFALLE
jgi:hypothetical protein